MQVLALGSLTPSLQSLRLAYIRVSRMLRTHHRRAEVYKPITQYADLGLCLGGTWHRYFTRRIYETHWIRDGLRRAAARAKSEVA